MCPGRQSQQETPLTQPEHQISGEFSPQSHPSLIRQKQLLNLAEKEKLNENLEKARSSTLSPPVRPPDIGLAAFHAAHPDLVAKIPKKAKKVTQPLGGQEDVKPPAPVKPGQQCPPTSPGWIFQNQHFPVAHRDGHEPLHPWQLPEILQEPGISPGSDVPAWGSCYQHGDRSKQSPTQTVLGRPQINPD